MQTTKRQTIFLIWFSYMALLVLLTFFVALPTAAKRPDSSDSMPWAIGIGLAVTGALYARLRVPSAPSFAKAQVEFLVAMALVELGALLGIFVFVPQGYPYWAPAVVGVTGILSVGFNLLTGLPPD
jgi:hypothetical protein